MWIFVFRSLNAKLFLIRVIYLSIKFFFANQNRLREQMSKEAFTLERKSSATFDWFLSNSAFLFQYECAFMVGDDFISVN